MALLRAVNVGGANKLPMADLRQILGGLRYENPRTVLQSGNAVFEAARPKPEDIAAAIPVHPTVMLFSRKDFEQIIRDNPFDGDMRYAVFLASPAKKPATLGTFPPDEYAFGNRVVYTRQPNGTMGTALPNWEKVLGRPATARGWATVLKIASAL